MSSVKQHFKIPPEPIQIQSKHPPSKSGSFLEDLPAELAVMILKKLNLSDVSHLALSCRRFNSLLKEGSYWNLRAQQLGRPLDSALSAKDYVRTVIQRVRQLLENNIFEGFSFEKGQVEVFQHKTTFQCAQALCDYPNGNLLAFLVPHVLPKIDPHFANPFPKLQGQPLQDFLEQASRDHTLEDIQLAVRCGALLSEETLRYLDQVEDPAPTIRSLMDAGLDINGTSASGHTLIDQVIRSGFDNCATAFIEMGATVGTKQIWLATLFKRPNVILQLIENGVGINEISNSGWTPLIAAIATHPELIPFLIDHGADVRVHGARGQPLDYAIQANRSEIIDCLIDRGANIEEINPFDHLRPLHKAASLGHLECLSILLSMGASINSTDPEGRTAIWHIANNEQGTPGKIHSTDRLMCLKMLASYQADLDLCDNEGNSPLIIAAKNYDYLVLKTLLKLGANPNQKNRDGQTPLEYLRSLKVPAAHNPYKKCRRLLEDARPLFQKFREHFFGKHQK